MCATVAHGAALCGQAVKSQLLRWGELRQRCPSQLSHGDLHPWMRSAKHTRLFTRNRSENCVFSGFTSGEDVFHPKGVLLDGCINNSSPHLRKHRKPVKAKQVVSGELNLLITRTSTGKVNYQNQDSSSTEKTVVGKAFSGS